MPIVNTSKMKAHKRVQIVSNQLKEMKPFVIQDLPDMLAHTADKAERKFKKLIDNQKEQIRKND